MARGGWAPFSLPLLLKKLIFFNRKEVRERKRKRGLGKDFEHGDNFTGLAKMILIQEKYKWACTKFGLELV